MAYKTISQILENVQNIHQTSYMKNKNQNLNGREGNVGLETVLF